MKYYLKYYFKSSLRGLPLRYLLLLCLVTVVMMFRSGFTPNIIFPAAQIALITYLTGFLMRTISVIILIKVMARDRGGDFLENLAYAQYVKKIGLYRMPPGEDMEEFLRKTREDDK